MRQQSTASLLIFGLGYCGTAVADAARAAGFDVTGTARHGSAAGTIPFDAAAPAIAAATHLLSTVPPDASKAGRSHAIPRVPPHNLLQCGRTVPERMPVSQIRTRIQVGPDHNVTGTVPNEVPPGEHEAVITVSSLPARRKAARPFDVNALPTVDLGPWPEGLTLRREDIYGDDGR